MERIQLFKTETLFIVGAGASKEANLPVGNELKSIIAKSIDIRFGGTGRQQESGDYEIMEALRAHASMRSTNENSRINVNDYLHAGWRIRDAMPQASSIDTFIDSHDGDEGIETCGKLAIAKAILEAEKASLLYVNHRRGDERPSFERLGNTWYSRIWQALTMERKRSELRDIFHNTGFIVFNYDRCIEHFFFHALQNFYGVNEGEAAKLSSSLRVHHPYGKVGDLPWQDGELRVEFGASPRGQGLLAISKQIKTFTEQVDDAHTLNEMRAMIGAAKNLVFLGFGFHEQNMQLLRPVVPPSTKRVFATSKGISSADRDVIENEIAELYGPEIGERLPIHTRTQITCCDLFDEYWRSLMA
ncbi:hypothetical protein [Pelagibius sp.]|uniref:hypothetical protein n=1 Tax=Pelagibius sp. TaxID=1931238 RepID=UPI003B512E3A